MKNGTITDYRAGISGWLMLIVVLVSLNALGDLGLFLWALSHSSATANGILSLNMYFVHIFANRTLFLIATPIVFVSSVLFLVFIGLRRLFLFKLSFLVTCTVSLGHLLVNAITMRPFVYFDIPVLPLYAERSMLAGMLIMSFKLLENATPFFIFTGITMAFAVLIACMIYFARSKKIALYFNDDQAQSK
jgi:hypothetical protein